MKRMSFHNLVMRTGLALGAAALVPLGAAGAIIPSSPDLGKAEGRCRRANRGRPCWCGWMG